jgi:D-alanine-D-alanine ligase-like ATP-grasp enzyme/acylphosphatase
MVARVEAAELARYVGPGRSLARPHGLVVRLRAGAAVGVGEAVVAGDQTDAAWQELREVAAGVVGTRPALSAPLAGPVDRGARRAAKLAVEMALLDLSRGAEPPVTPYPHQPLHPLPRVPPGAPGDELSAVLAADSGSGWAVRLQSTGDAELDLAWLRSAAGLGRPLWLVGGGWDPAGASRFVRRLAELMRDGELAGEVLVEEPLAPSRRSLLTKVRERSALARFQRRSPLRDLQRAADAVLGGTGQRLRIVAGESVVSGTQARALAGSVGAVHLSLSRFGSLLGLQEAARAVKRADPAALVLVAGERGSRVTEAALAALVADTPEVDLYLPEPQPGWPVLLGKRFDIGELASVADELAVIPQPPAPAAEPANTFPDYPMSGAALAVRSMLLETEALRIGLRTRRLARDFFLAEHPESGAAIGFFDSESDATSFAGSACAAHKGVTRELLERAGLPVPPGDSFPVAERDRAHAAGVRLGFPLVVKPAGGSKGIAVTVGIRSEDELARALDEAAACRYADTGMVVERFATGSDYRVLATRTEVLSVVRREPASVVGDGQRSVEELVLAANVARRKNPHLAKRLITLDDRVDEQLRRQRLGRESVPAAGRRVLLRAEANLSLGGDSREVLDTVHPSVRELAVAAVAAVPGLPYAGLDILMEDHRRPVDGQQVAIIEVNSRPVQSLHHFPMYGPPRNVSARLVGDAVAQAGWPVEDGRDRLTVRFVVSGKVRGVGYPRWLAGIATRLGLDGWVGHAGDDRLDGLVHGTAPRVGLLLRLGFRGPAGAAVVETYAEPVGTVPATGFTIRRDGHERR